MEESGKRIRILKAEFIWNSVRLFGYDVITWPSKVIGFSDGSEVSIQDDIISIRNQDSERGFLISRHQGIALYRNFGRISGENWTINVQKNRKMVICYNGSFLDETNGSSTVDSSDALEIVWLGKYSIECKFCDSICDDLIKLSLYFLMYNRWKNHDVTGFS